MLFKKKREDDLENYTGPGRNPFKAIPVRVKEVEMRVDDDSLIQLRKKVQPKQGVRDFLARKIKIRKDYKIHLDERGSFFWRLIDGKRTLREIEKIIRKKYSLKAYESKKAVLMFTKTLMLRYLIYLELPATDREGSKGNQSDARPKTHTN